MEEGKRVRVIKPADKEHKTKKIGRQTVIDEDLIDIFISLKKEHGRNISDSILRDSFKKNPFDFQRFLANQLNGDMNTGGIDGVIGPKTAIDASRINYAYNLNDVQPELAGNLPTAIVRDTDKNTIYNTSKNSVPDLPQSKKGRKAKSGYKVKKKGLRKY